MNKEFYEITKDLINNPTVLQMKKYNLDYDSIARSAILHD